MTRDSTMDQTLAEYRAKLKEAGQLTAERRAYWRGRRVRGAGHPLRWYDAALLAYSKLERHAFLDGYHLRQFTEPKP